MSLENYQIASKTIIDFKPISPMLGDLFKGRNPLEIALQLEKAGVLGLSVVTKEEHFGGSLNLLRQLAKTVKLPILRKDFIKTDDDLKETLDNGATGVLLICATCQNIAALHHKALLLGLKPVVEVHNAFEMSLAKDMDAKIVGINNKDITVLEKDGGDVNLTLKLIKTAPKDAFLISESGIKNNKDAQTALDAGANAVLVGTAFWQGNFKVF
jgi:indole-3-glycerol phosphate synthase